MLRARRWSSDDVAEHAEIEGPASWRATMLQDATMRCVLAWSVTTLPWNWGVSPEFRELGGPPGR
jgi:hypothetical protein